MLPQALPRLTPMSLMGGWTLAFNLNQSVVDHLQRRRLPATGGVWDRGMQRQPMTGPLALGRKAQAVWVLFWHRSGMRAVERHFAPVSALAPCSRLVISAVRLNVWMANTQHSTSKVFILSNTIET